MYHRPGAGSPRTQGYTANGAGDGSGRFSPPPRYRGTAPGSTSRLSSRQGARSASPPKMNLNELDHKAIVALSQQTTDELEVKQREKSALTKLLAELKRRKLTMDGKVSKKHRDIDQTIVQTMEMNKKLENIAASNKMMSSELAGLRSENERMEAEVEQLRANFQEATVTYDKECVNVEKAKRLLYNYRKEISAETKQRDNIQSDLRASRTAQLLMINRLDEMEKRSHALRSCVANTFSH
eukprot:TRINITY_DN35360_c0_g2_i1.p1 TRINITY_DN35360_c0_g2~~TRINITY_DN35360_c0_g2_i1.p1  ORF type:complete len:240 (+),score=53.56 TRINITY_DN35360_c0_g2_i1:82-801(+)